MLALKAQWVVKAGLIAGESMDGHARAWSYTSEDYEADGNHRGERFNRMAADANDYAMGLQEGGLNWVTLEYMWM